MKTLGNRKRFYRMILTGAGVIAGTLFNAQAQPTISVEPKDAFVDLGKNATFSVSIPSSSSPVTCQWFFNGVELPGATNRSLGLSQAQPARTGDYFVIVSNASGSVTSRVARLKVFAAAPHGFSHIGLTAPGSVDLGLAGETSALFQQYFDLYPLEASSNLVDWSPLTTLVRTNTATNTLHFLDTNAHGSDRRFYRTPTNLLITFLPKPTGPYPVGTFSRLLTDPSRTNAARRTNHQFMITVWYPAVAQVGRLPAPYVDKAVAQNTDYYESFTDRVPSFFSHSFTDAPLSDHRARFPVLLYSCGGWMHRRDNTELTEELASWGYVVVGMDHRTTVLSVLPDGKRVYGAIDTSSIAKFATQLDDRVLDARFVLDELARWDAADPLFNGRLDLGKIGAFGWSFGGAMSAELARVDSRCRASVNMDGIFFKTNLLTERFETPLMILRAASPDPDLSPSLTFGGVPAYDVIYIYNALTTNAYWVKLSNTEHRNFGYYGLIWDPVTFATEFSGLPPQQQTPGLRVCQITRAYLRSFFNKFLLGEDDHLLDGPSPDYPEVMQFLKK